MSTKVRQSGLVGTNNRWGTSGAFTLSDGTAVLVFYDANDATAAAGWGERNGTAKVYVYSSVDRANWTLRATITPPITSGVRVTAAVSQDNSLGILAFGPLQARYVRVAPDWTVGTWEQVHTAVVAPNNNDEASISFTDGNVPVVAILRSTNTGSTRLRIQAYCRETTTNTWPSSGTTIANLETTSTPKAVFNTLSILCLTGGTASARNVVFAAGHGTGTTDKGVDLYTATLAESTAVYTNMTKRATYEVGAVPGGSTATNSRNAVLFPSDTNEYTLGIQHWQGGRRYGLTVGTFNGTTWATTRAWTFSRVPTDYTLLEFGMCMTYSSGRLNFIYLTNGGFRSFLAKISETSITFADEKFFDNSMRDVYTPSAGVSPHVQWPRHDVIFINKIASTKQDLRHHYIIPSRAPERIAPSAGSTVTTSVPVLRAYADLDIKYPQSLTKIRWEFAQNSGFTTNFKYYQQDDSSLKLVANTNLTGSTVLFEDRLPVSLALKSGLWYVRAAHVDEYGVIGSYSPSTTFTVAHPPAAANLTPDDDQAIVYGSGVITFAWKFTDPYEYDKQSAFQLIVEESDTGTIVLDTGKVASLLEGTNQTIPVGEKDKPLRSKVALWDIDDQPGAFTNYSTFSVVDKPTVSITSPANGSTVTNAGTDILLSTAVGGNRSIVSYTMTITSGESTLANDVVLVSLPGGGTITHHLDPDLLINSTTYTATATVVDNLGIESTIATSTFSTSWIPPLSASNVVINATPYNTEGQGWVAVNWTDTNRDVDFTSYAVYRRSDMIDPNTGATLETGTREKIATITDTASSYTYKDYFARSGYLTHYWVEQIVNRFGDTVESEGTVASSLIPISDSYWVIQPDSNDAFQLGSVNSDSYDEEYEEEEITLIGRGRRVEQGDRLGYTGSLTTKIRDRAGVSARQRKLRLENLKKEQRQLFLRNPYGDVFRVAVKTMNVGRIAGVGTSEFVDVTIPYVEVSE